VQRPLERERWCSRCKRYVLARENMLNFQVHGCLCVLTLGLWLIPFSLVAFHNALAGRFRCTRCGKRC
jgi:hypothetical protein